MKLPNLVNDRMGHWLYWMLHVPSAVLRFVARVTFTVWFGGKGRTVPRVKNPLLLKSATQLAKEIREGKIKSEDVILAYTERILEVEPYINATVERRFLEAANEAQEVDSLIRSGKYTTEQLSREKPLLGVPLTVKVLLTVKGLKCTAGSYLYENMVAAEDAPAVALMKKAGAIVLATTNSAECGLNIETNNKIHGRTCNPYDTNRTSGGSSGGESALIASGGSVLGLGNDLIGSIRIPCHYTGLFGHKPTIKLVPNEGCHPTPHPDVLHFLYTGPMCRYAEDLVLSMRILSSQKEHSVQFGATVNFEKIKILHVQDIIVPLVCDMDENIARDIQKAVSHFKAKYGSITKKIHLSHMYDFNRCLMSNIVYPFGDDMVSTITLRKDINEKFELLKCLFGKSILSIAPLVVMNGSHIPLLYKKKNHKYYENMLQKLVVQFEHLLDENTVMLMPTLPFTAPYHNESLFRLPSTVYTSIFNGVGLPSTQCPLGISKDGLPYGMQIVSKWNNDNLTIACAMELEKQFGGWKNPGDI